MAKRLTSQENVTSFVTQALIGAALQQITAAFEVNETSIDLTRKPSSQIVQAGSSVISSLTFGWNGVVIQYDPDTQQIVYTAQVQNNQWMGLGYGTDMDNTEYIIWQADRGQSTANPYYSPSATKPTQIQYQDTCYTTTQVDNGINVQFTTTRPLDCSDTVGTPSISPTYVIQLDQSTDFVNAFSPPGGSYQLSFHQSNAESFSATIDSSGTPYVQEISGQQPTSQPDPPTDTPTIQASNGSSITIQYDSTIGVQYWAKVVDNSWLGLGYGTDMDNTEYIIWQANGNESTALPYFSQKPGLPSQVVYNPLCYTSTATKGDGYIEFYTIRPLSCESSDPTITVPTYEIQLDQETDFVYAFTAPGGTYQLAYHKSDVGQFSCTLQDGTPCSQDPSPSPGPTPPPTPTPTPEPTPTPGQNSLTVSNGSTLDFLYDSKTNTVNFTAVVKDNTYLSLGFGDSMFDTEVVTWQANGASSVQNAQYSTADGVTPYPITYSPTCYTTTFEQNSADNTVTFTTSRPLECTTDSIQNSSTTFAIQLDQDDNYIYAFTQDGGSYEFQNHGNHKGKFSCTLLSDGTPCNGAVKESNSFLVHGILMWLAWCLIALGQVYTNRYMRHQWKYRQLAHSVLGVLSMAVTLGAGFIALASKNWHITKGIHDIMGFVTMCSAVLLTLGGLASLLKRKLQRETEAWDSSGLNRFIAKIHKYFGFLIIFGSQATMIAGVFALYGGKDQFNDSAIAITVSIQLLFWSLLAFGEYQYRKTLTGVVPFLTHPNTINKVEFRRLVEEGRQLLILDELVLDVEEFIHHHPGGKFFIKQNIGRDISKFFYGGYAMEGNRPGQPILGYNHSNIARMIVNSITIGRYEPQVAVATATCKIRTDLTSTVNRHTSVFVFEEIAQNTLVNFKRFYPGFECMTKHFLLRNLQNEKVFRHYTICNAMIPEVYNMYISLLKNFDPRKSLIRSKEDQSDDISKLISLLSMKDQNCMNLCIKNYNTQTGVSEKVHRESVMQTEMTYELKGPLGKGLLPKPTGIHIAFAAGTGALCFVDLVAHLIQANLGILADVNNQSKIFEAQEVEDYIDDGATCQLDKFQFHLYVSFPNREESIALELFEALNNFCQRFGLNNFELFVRMPKENLNTARWDNTFIKQELEKFNISELSRIWVCGPPAMNEQFDRTLIELKRTSGLRDDQFEIL